MATRTERTIYKGLAIFVCVIILGAVFFPVFGGGGDRLPVACLSNTKQLATGTLIYMVDSEETLPVGRSLAGPTVVGWGRRIYPYVKNGAIFTDPAETKNLESPERERFRVSYAMNANAAATPDAIDTNDANASRLVILFEIEGARPGRGGELQSTLALSPAGDGAAGGLLDSVDPNLEPVARPATGPLDNSGLDPKHQPRHRNRSNFAFLDGSARACASNEVSAGVSARKSSDKQTPSGCVRPDLPGITRPCAEGAARTDHRATFSLR